MKVLQLGKFFPIKGGVEKVEYDLMKGLSEHGIDCDMLCASAKKSEQQINGHARLFCVRTWIKIAGTTIAPSMITRLWRTCREYDIIHVHHPDPMACLALFFSRYRGKVILHWHSDIIRQKKLLGLYRPLQRWLIQRANIIVGTTPIYIKESEELKDAQHKTAHLLIGIEEIAQNFIGAQKLHELYNGRKIVFSLGRLVPYKGYSYLIEAAQHLPDDYVVAIGGTGPLYEELNRLIIDKGLENKVKLLGFVKDEEVSAYYTACKIFVLPSIQKTEAFGIVQIEAMSGGKPVVATTIPGSGTSWVNAHGISGLNVTPKQSKELAEAILEITKDEDTYKRFCKDARLRYENEFTKEQMIKGAINIYNTLKDTKEHA